MFFRLISFCIRKSRYAVLPAVLYLLVVVVYFHLPWSVRMPLHRMAPQANKALMKSGFAVMNGWDQLALFGRDASVKVSAAERGDFVFGGYPKQPMSLFGGVKQLASPGFVVGYSEGMKNPLWVAYRVFDVPKLQSGKRPSSFKVDGRTRAKVRHGDYTRSGYDRGHMAPNYAIATRFGTRGQRATFYMSNIIPQTPWVNRGIWKDLEMRVAKQYGRYFGEVWVITGPIFEKPLEKLDSGVPIPSAYYKIVVDQHGDSFRALAFVIEKDCPPYTRVRKRLVSIDELEQRVELDFFPNLDERTQERLEAEPATRLWRWFPAAFRYHF